MVASDSADSGAARTTSLSLLARVRAQEESAWDRLVHIYTPLVRRWCRKWSLQPDDVADISQEVFSGVARGIDGFRRDNPGDSFRGWLAVESSKFWTRVWLDCRDRCPGLLEKC
ncbi:MAG: sigma factor [Planctomycetota bacterium]|nr:sigma factor [Planctomycetota bacterium]